MCEGRGSFRSETMEWEGEGRVGGLASESVEQLFQRKESVLSEMRLFQFPPKMEESSKEEDTQLQILQRRCCNCLV